MHARVEHAKQDSLRHFKALKHFSSTLGVVFSAMSRVYPESSPTAREELLGQSNISISVAC